jgi:putative DNA methylase
MIPKECKRLAEVDFPIAVVSKHSAREKSIRHGHPSTLHLWWARRPLAACRSMLLGLLLPDPCDPHCPPEFKIKAKAALLDAPGCGSERNKQQMKTDEGLRKALLTFIGDVANWDNANHPGWIGTAQALVKAAHPEETPLVVDPFSGGGSIPLEALRLGCEAFASDLNPVACLILKVILEDIPRHGPELAEELRRVGGEIKKQAEKELSEFYPKDPDGATPIAYLWARTVRCESPNCGAEIPLVRSFWLSKNGSRKQAVRWSSEGVNKQKGCAEFGVFEPKTEDDVQPGTVSRARATCLCCGMVLPPERVRAQLSKQRGGADPVFDREGNRIAGARIMAVVVTRAGEQGRKYRLPTDADYQAIFNAHNRLRELLQEWNNSGKNGPCPVPDEPTPTKDTHRAVGSQLSLYGILNFGDLFTARQKVALAEISRMVTSHEASDKTISGLLAFSFNRVAMSGMSCTRWNAVAEKMQHTFGRQALPMVWDFAEVVPTAKAPGNWVSGYEIVADVVQAAPRSDGGQVQIANAVSHPLPDQTANVWFTDPPYYDAIPYADLSDFFLVWLKRTLRNTTFARDPFDPANPLSPKTREIVLCERVKDETGSPKDRQFYETAMGLAFAEGRRVLLEDGVGAVVFAHKTTEGWEALLSGMIAGGWTITGSWPIATEMGSRLNAMATAALATSIHLVCRPRPDDASVGDWGEVLRELPNRVGDWMERLQNEGVRGADLVFACIGPALEIFSRYRKVETADGKEVKLAEYLLKVWEVVGRSALEQILGTAEARARNGAAGALEEDARLTALFLWTLQSTNGKDEGGRMKDEGADDGSDPSESSEDEEEEAPKGRAKGFSLVFDVARRFAQPLGVDLPKWEGRIIETKKGVVRLLAVSERAKQLFGDDGADAVADLLESDPKKDLQQLLFPELEEEQVPKVRGRRGRIVTDGRDLEMKTEHAATTLDRVHAAMLLQASGQANGLRALIKAEQQRGPEFLRLANALSALYPTGSEEKRLLDAMLLAVPR